MNKKAKSSLILSALFIFFYIAGEIILTYYHPADSKIVGLLNLVSGSQFITLFFAGFFALSFIVNLRSPDEKGKKH